MALRNLRRPAKLRSSPLLNLPSVRSNLALAGSHSSPDGLALSLRTRLETIIDDLRPNDQEDLGKRAWLRYYILHHVFQKGHSPQSVQHTLAIGHTFFYKLRNEAIDTIATHLEAGTLHEQHQVPHNLPPQPTPFVGRAHELAQIDRTLKTPSCRLLTLVGVGGIGKTRLALEAALRVAAEGSSAFRHGIYLVSLAAIDSVALLAATIGDVLKLSFRGSRDQRIQLLDYLGEKEMLLLLDNFENLHDGIDLVLEILNNAPTVSLLITSKEPLNLSWEWTLKVQGLTCPSVTQGVALEDYDATQLFLYCANRASAGFSPSKYEEPFIIRICQNLGGMPLAIELVAAWVRTLSCEEIAQELERSLALLTTSLQDVPERHRSLQAVFDHSWNLLTEKEREIFARLSVFMGGFSREAATQVTGASLTTLSGLVNRSILGKNAEKRYEMLEPLRRYAEDKLGQDSRERDIVHDQHCDFYAEFLQQREKDLEAGRQKEAQAEIAREIDNVRTAWQWAIEQKKIQTLAKSLKSLAIFYDMQNWYQEGESAFRRATEKLENVCHTPDIVERENNLVLGRLYERRGWFCVRLPRFIEAKELLETSLSIFRRLGARREMTYTLRSLGCTVLLLGEYSKAEQLVRESLAIHQEYDDWQEIAKSLSTLGFFAYMMGNLAEAEPLYQRALAVLRQVGDQWRTAHCLNKLGSIAHTQGEHTKAKQLYQASLAINRELGDLAEEALCLNNLGNLEAEMGKYLEARKLLYESLAIYRQVGSRMGAPTALNRSVIADGYTEAEQLLPDRLMIIREDNAQWGVVNCINNLANVALKLKEYKEAKRLYQENLDLLETMGDHWGMATCLGSLGFVAKTLGQYTEAQESYQQAVTVCREIGDQEGLVKNLNGLGTVLWTLGHQRETNECFQEALGTATSIQALPLILDALLGLATSLAGQEGQEEQAVEMAAHALHHPVLDTKARARAERLLSQLESQLSPQAFAAAQERGKKEPPRP
ncbi:MAG: tetratricopeptide repeat protein [Anaerolineales bacterium]|nr:tetratricopeptide repeat protein [Anaerolineales bacterium]